MPSRGGAQVRERKQRLAELKEVKEGVKVQHSRTISLECSMLTTMMHRNCAWTSCECVCHTNHAPENYTEPGNYHKVRRIG